MATVGRSRRQFSWLVMPTNHFHPRFFRRRDFLHHTRPGLPRRPTADRPSTQHSREADILPKEVPKSKTSLESRPLDLSRSIAWCLFLGRGNEMCQPQVGLLGMGGLQSPRSAIPIVSHATTTCHFRSDLPKLG